jgi:hypothetical protein
MGRITRQVPADRPMPFAAPGRPRRKRKAHHVAKSPTPPKKRRRSSGAKFLRLAKEWQRQLDDGEIASQAAIARREGITRARVSQIMSLLRLAPPLQRRILSVKANSGEIIAERALRRLARIGDRTRQLEAFSQMCAARS